MARLIAALLAVFATQGVAFAQSRYAWIDLGVLTNCSAAAINSAINCEIKNSSLGVTSLNGYNLATLEIFYDDNAGGAGTGFTYSLQQCSEGVGDDKCTDSTDWSTIVSDAVSSGTVTLSLGVFTVSSDADIRLTYSHGLNYQRVRLGGIVGTGAPGATDKITVKARVAYTPAY